MSVARIRKWLQGRDDYSLQTTPRKSIPRVPVVTTGLQSLILDTDLLQIDNIAHYNDGIRFLLIVIDDFSRFLSVEHIRNKTAKNVLAGMKSIFSRMPKPRTLRSDAGKEYNNTLMKNYMNALNYKKRLLPRCIHHNRI